jgi:hypothetical protein
MCWNRTAYQPVRINPKGPLQLAEAENAVEIARLAGADRYADTATLLTNGLCRRDKRRPRAARPRISSLSGITPVGAAGPRQSQKPRIMGSFCGFCGAC